MSELSRAQDDISLQKKCEKILAKWWGMTGGDPNVYLYRAAYADGAEESKNIIAQQAQELEQAKGNYAIQKAAADDYEQQLAASQARCREMETELQKEHERSTAHFDLCVHKDTELAQLQATLAQQAQEVTKLKSAEHALTEAILRCFGWEVNVDSGGKDGTVYRRKDWRDSTRYVVYACTVLEIIETEAQEIERLNNDVGMLRDEPARLKQQLAASQARCRELEDHVGHYKSVSTGQYLKLTEAKTEIAQLQATLAAREEEVSQLNTVLRESGWGQGEIDSAAYTFEKLAQANRKLVAERDAAVQEAGRLRSVLKKIAKPALGGKQQQWMAQEALKGA